MAIFATAAIALLIYNLRQTASSRVISFAVRPLADESPARDQDYFCDGVTEELSTRLGLFPALRVISSNSVFRLRNANSAELVRQLRLDAMLEGEVLKDAGRLRIHVRLSRVAESAPVWEQTYDEPAGSEVAIEDKIVREVIPKLNAGLVRAVRSTKIAEAHDLYLRGRAALRNGPGAASPQAAAFFQQATVKDPQYPLALAGLAQAYGLAPEARAAALQALTYDESLGEAHVSLARVLMWNDADWETAEKELNRARTLNPQYPETYLLLAKLFAFRARNQEAVDLLERALDVDPLSPHVHNTRAEVLLFARDYPDAITSARRAIELDSEFATAHRTLGRALMLSGNSDGGIAALKKAGPVAEAWGLALAGRADEAREAMRILSTGLAPQPIEVARVYAALGDMDEAFRWLDRVEPRGFLAEIVAPDWDKIRPDPRYAALLKKIGLATK